MLLVAEDERGKQVGEQLLGEAVDVTPELKPVGFGVAEDKAVQLRSAACL